MDYKEVVDLFTSGEEGRAELDRLFAPTERVEVVPPLHPGLPEWDKLFGRSSSREVRPAKPEVGHKARTEQLRATVLEEPGAQSSAPDLGTLDVADSPETLLAMQRDIFDYVLRSGQGASIAKIATATGRPTATVRAAAAALEREGLVLKTDDVLTLDLDRSCAIGITIAPERIIGIVSSLRAKRLVEPISRPLEGSDHEAIVATVTQVVAALLQGIQREPHSRRIVGLGVNLSGVVNTNDFGRILYSSRLPQLHDVQLGSALYDKTGLTTIVENNANALASYEQFFGDGRGLSDFVVVNIGGTGVGSGVVSNGNLVHGAIGMAGEVGHLPVVWEDEPRGLCRCGNYGCLETLVSIKSIRDRLQLPPPSGSPFTLNDIASKISTRDSEGADAFVSAGRVLGRALAMVRNILDPALMILSGPAELLDKARWYTATTFLSEVRDAAGKSTSGLREKKEYKELESILITKPTLDENDTFLSQAKGAAAAVVGNYATRAIATWQVITPAEVFERLGQDGEKQL